MGYIGNQITSVPFTFDRLSGDGSRTTFIMSRAPAAPASVMVFISGVYKVPEVDYTVSGTDITFTVAPASGTNNIVVHHIGNGAAATQIPVTGSVTTDKIGTQAVRGNQIGLGAVSGNNIAGINSINASNSLTALSITGNLIGTGAISANNIVAGQVLSNALASNVAITDFSANNTFAVPIFASNAARDIAITSPRDGLVALITTGSQFQGYVGSGWIVLNN